MGNISVYWGLIFLLTFILFLCGSAISKKRGVNTNFYFGVAILSFALVEGLRWMRGTDYYDYYSLVLNGTANARITEPVFCFFVDIIHYLQLNPTWFFVISSALLIGSYTPIFKKRPEAAILGIPLIYCCLGVQAENLVRQYLAIPFLILAYNYYCNDDRKKMLLCLAMAPLVHYSAILVVLIFVLMAYVKLPVGKPYIFAIIYIVLFFLWDSAYLDQFAIVISAINFGDLNVYSDFTDNAYKWFTDEGGNGSGFTSIVVITVEFLTQLSIIVFGHEACKKDPKLYILYYFAFISILISIIAGDIQLLFRMGYWFSWTLPIIVGIIVSFNYAKYSPYIKTICSMLYLLYFVYALNFHHLGTIPFSEGCMFVWDK